MRKSAPTNAWHLRRRRSTLSASKAKKKAAILATLRYLLAPEDTSGGAGPALLPLPSLATQILKAIFWMGAAVAAGLGVALLD